jgi:hypothetical protein
VDHYLTQLIPSDDPDNQYWLDFLFKIIKCPIGGPRAFRGLKTLTVVHVPAPEGVGDPIMSDFSGDLVFSEVEDNPGEFHAWEIKHDSGGSSAVIIEPWILPRGRWTWERAAAAWWETLEDIKLDKKFSVDLSTVRLVGHRHLEDEPRWKDGA